jgi:ArsR family transcriptional regulator, lead/cadmium/zinc/bismuth-responsive transcriptional repressor
MEKDKTCIRVYADQERLKICSQKLVDARESIQMLSQVLSMAGSETRLQILYLLKEEAELCVCDISDVLHMTMPAVSQQLRKLKDANIIQSKKVGQTVFYALKQQYLDVIQPLFQYIDGKPKVEETI